MEVLSKLKSWFSSNMVGNSFRILTYKFTKNKKDLLQIHIDIIDFNGLLKDILEDPAASILWNDIKERYSKNIGEQDLYKVFQFFLFAFMIKYSLEKAAEESSPLGLIKDDDGYDYYKKLFGGNLDEKTFKKLVEEMWKYMHSIEFYEKIVK